MALHPRSDEVTPTDVHLVITPTARGQDLYAWIALPSTASCGDARDAARDMRRSADGARLEAACVAEVVLGDPARRKAYDELRARAAAAGVPLPVIGPAMPATALPPPPRVRARKWLLANGPKLLEASARATQITGRFAVNVLKVVFAIMLLIGGLVCIAKYSPPAKDHRYDVRIPEYHYTPMPDFTIPEYHYDPIVIPDYKVPDLQLAPDIYEPPPKPKRHHRKKSSR